MLILPFQGIIIEYIIITERGIKMDSAASTAAVVSAMAEAMPMSQFIVIVKSYLSKMVES